MASSRDRDQVGGGFKRGFRLFPLFLGNDHLALADQLRQGIECDLCRHEHPRFALDRPSRDSPELHVSEGAGELLQLLLGRVDVDSGQTQEAHGLRMPDCPAREYPAYSVGLKLSRSNSEVRLVLATDRWWGGGREKSTFRQALGGHSLSDSRVAARDISGPRSDPLICRDFGHVSPTTSRTRKVSAPMIVMWAGIGGGHSACRPERRAECPE